MPKNDWRCYVGKDLLEYKFTDERIKKIQMVININQDYISRLGLMKWIEEISGDEGYIYNAEIFSIIYGELMHSVLSWK